MFLNYYASLLSPFLLAIAWSKSNRLPIEFSVLTLNAVLFLSTFVRDVKLILLGNDYSQRLFTTVEVNMLVAVVLGLYLGIRRRWSASVAALLLAVGWLAVGAINSAV